MNFLEIYQKAIHMNRMVNIDPRPEQLIPNVYNYEGAQLSVNPDDYLHLLAGGAIHIEFPLSVSFSPLPHYLMLYTTRGAGSIGCNGHTISVDEGQLLLLDLRRPFSLKSRILPWECKLFFLDGRDISLFTLRPQSCPEYGLFTVPKYSSVPHCLDALLSISTCPTFPELILMHRNLTELLSALVLARMPAPIRTEAVSDYLMEMQDYLEHHYFEEISLALFEERFHISRYRLCREFSAAFGKSPLNYLICSRMAAAKKMLLTTDQTVHEISSSVGYENTTHFIRLFQKYNGMTPGVFRQKAPEGQSFLHCSVQ